MNARLVPLLTSLLLTLPVGGLTAQDAPAPGVAGPAAAEFDRTFTQWKALLAELGELKLKYRAADESQRAAIKTQWDQLVQKGPAMQNELIQAAEKAYAEAPNADKQVTELLVDVLNQHNQTDNYEESLRLGKMLMDNRCGDKQAADLAGIAAFATGDLDAAEKYLGLAQQQKSLSEMGEYYLQSLPKYKQLWAKERAIREAEAKADDLPRVLLTTSKGDVEIELFENEAPDAAANFISLVEKGYYDGLTFHRVLPGFMAQGGCPDGTGTGGPGYTIPCECYRPDYRKHFRGTLSMAHAGRDTGGSQFFLTFVPTGHLDGKHTAFGRVVKGVEVLGKIQRRDPEDPAAPAPDKILKAKVLRKRPHEYVPKKT